MTTPLPEPDENDDQGNLVNFSLELIRAYGAAEYKRGADKEQELTASLSRMTELVGVLTAERNELSRLYKNTLKREYALQQERDEQCRLNGMGAEREYVLLGKVAQLERESDALRAAAQAAINLLGPTAPDCCGCEYEWNHAITQLQAAMKGTS